MRHGTRQLLVPLGLGCKCSCSSSLCQSVREGVAGGATCTSAWHKVKVMSACGHGTWQLLVLLIMGFCYPVLLLLLLLLLLPYRCAGVTGWSSILPCSATAAQLL
jgi:hypothetical protein